jgi:hypothetical protein
LVQMRLFDLLWRISFPLLHIDFQLLRQSLYRTLCPLYHPFYPSRVLSVLHRACFRSRCFWCSVE